MKTSVHIHGEADFILILYFVLLIALYVESNLFNRFDSNCISSHLFLSMLTRPMWCMLIGWLNRQKIWSSCDMHMSIQCTDRSPSSYLQVQERDVGRSFSDSPRRTGRELPFLRGWRWWVKTVSSNSNWTEPNHLSISSTLPKVKTN